MTSLARDIVDAYNAGRIVRSPTTLCYAPETSLNFFTDGYVSACCASRTFPVGSYPAKTIEEIWQGARVASLRRSLRDDNPPNACQGCRDHFESGNFSNALARNFDPIPVFGHPVDASAPRLQLIEFEISNSCNLECVMCNGWNSSAIRRNRDRLPALESPYDDAFVDQLGPFLPYLHEARFLGGEPFLVPIYYRIWNALIDVNPSISTVITTNGTIMNRKVRDVLDRLKPGIVVSCDSMDRATYEAIRVNARFDDVMANIETFRHASQEAGSHFGIAACPMPQNWRTIPGIVDFCNDRNVPLCFNTVLEPAANSIRALPREEIETIHGYLSDAMPRPTRRELGQEHVAANLERYRGLLSQLAGWTGVREGSVDVSIRGSRLRTLSERVRLQRRG